MIYMLIPQHPRSQIQQLWSQVEVSRRWWLFVWVVLFAPRFIRPRNTYLHMFSVSLSLLFSHSLLLHVQLTALLCIPPTQ
jgi:hypothetical protein